MAVSTFINFGFKAFEFLTKFFKKEVLVSAKVVDYSPVFWSYSETEKLYEDFELTIVNYTNQHITIEKIIIVLKKGSEFVNHTMMKRKTFEPKKTTTFRLDEKFKVGYLTGYSTFFIAMHILGSKKVYRSKEFLIDA